MVALAFGQSHVANFGETPKTATQDVYNYYDGKFYRAQDPLLGTDGASESVWTKLGDKLIERNLYDAVVFIPLARNSTLEIRWRSSSAHS